MKKQEFFGLPLTAAYFEIFLDELEETFKKKHGIKEIPKSMQFYGYGNYDSERPNLKEDLEHIGSDFINGKYLYDKVRDFRKGKPIIKLNQYYKSVLLLYLGYDSVESFLDENRLEGLKEKKQHALLYDETANKTYYYLNYYSGEDDIILKGETTVSNNWKKIKHTYVYPQEDGSTKEHYNFGNIIRREDTLHISSKTLLDGKLVEGASEIYYIGHSEPSNVKYLIGTYCTFDIYTNTVAGQSILERCESKEDMEEKSKDPHIPPYIAMEVRNKRIVNKSIVPKHFLEISDESPYASIYESLAGSYTLTFFFPDGFIEKLHFKILPTNYKMVVQTENVYFEKDNMDLLNKGSVVHFNLDLSGIIAFDHVDIYFKTYFLKDDSEKQDGVFSGIDNENRLVSGSVTINFNKS
ncbi:hypothetical protein [Zobellia barbeyronii]|uniref:Uncharacterized protein n=1 Tax=Zobellia barbeyronii TaxID=2748009 RepID=A0ABS5W9T5_9FLAO|nr:hypothetical protein [Zobellia barbeyronii]MBT2160176.1 hypothetical protein [Zobellia barbeyronii]